MSAPPSRPALPAFGVAACKLSQQKGRARAGAKNDSLKGVQDADGKEHDRQDKRARRR
ncbi:hypothetical protein [Aureimonas populi]|uniref:Uncharacterized protein n=1 Tax=Aureimonas populi TaxID=1701758 RepID=A0ABW5CJM3_9HYPH|nr:hypothetical protein [Aureimonas populi]